LERTTSPRDFRIPGGAKLPALRSHLEILTDDPIALSG
jgi:hypothetical protein